MTLKVEGSSPFEHPIKLVEIRLFLCGKFDISHFSHTMCIYFITPKMNISLFLFPFLCSFLVGCSAPNTPDVHIPYPQERKYISENIPPPENIPHLPPVETKSPNSQYEIAFENQTRAPGTKSAFTPKLVLITDTLHSPWGIAPLPDGRLLVTEKTGNIRIVSPDGNV